MHRLGQRREPCSRRSTWTSPASTSTRWPGSMRASRPRIGVWGCSPTWTTSRRLRPEAPTLPADQLHPWVWDAARTFWDAGAHAVAVEQAAKSITAHTQQKTGYQLADDDLMSQVWSDEPTKADRPRLRFPGNRNAKTWQSRQRGARSLAQGCYGGIRNVVAHENAPDWRNSSPLSTSRACQSWPAGSTRPRSKERPNQPHGSVRGGSAQHREPLVLGGHERSRPACENRRSYSIQSSDLGRRSRMGPGSNPTFDPKAALTRPWRREAPGHAVWSRHSGQWSGLRPRSRVR